MFDLAAKDAGVALDSNVFVHCVVPEECIKYEKQPKRWGELS